MLSRVVALLLLASPAAAAPSLCPDQFHAGQAPAILNPKLNAGARALCFDAFAVLHSAVTRTPLYSAEHLTAARLAEARGQPRQGEFHPEASLPPEERADLSDYARSGWDRGHMSPSGDMPDQQAQQQSFSLANMVPQAQQLNRGTWERIESAVRTLAGRRGDLYVVTGPIFRGQQLQTIGRVVVPSHVFKAVLDPTRGEAAAYVAQNADAGAWQAVSIAQLADLTGLDIFPALSWRGRYFPMRLPAPRPPRHRGAN